MNCVVKYKNDGIFLPRCLHLMERIGDYMDNHIFRSAAWGFHRQDVMDYIQQTQQEAESTSAALSKDLDDTRADRDDLRQQLENSTGQVESLSQELDELRKLFEQEKNQRELLAVTVQQLEGEIQTLTEENKRLECQVESLTAQSEDVRREKESLTQLELDARRRAEELMNHTQAEAQQILDQAQCDAEKKRADAEHLASETVDHAQAQRDALLADAQEKIEASVKQCGQLFADSEKITSNIAGELRRLSSINGRLPGFFNSLKKSLSELRDMSAQE